MDPKTAIVSGGNRGIGIETCRQLARRGFRVVLTSRDEPAGKQAVRQLEKKALNLDYHQLDVTDKKSIRELVHYAQAKLGRVDVLVNNAGVFLDENVSILDVEYEVLERTMDVNFRGAFYLSQAMLPLMQRQGYGRIVNVSSGYGSMSGLSGPHSGAYKISKVALNAYTRLLADAVPPSQIKVNAMCPGWVRTEMGGPAATRTPAQAADTIIWLAELPADGPSGGFFRDRKPIEW